MRILAIITSLALLSLTGCDDKPPTPTGPVTKAPTVATTKPTAKPTAEPGAELDNEDIPVAADYEDKAEKEITEDNLKDKLAEFEKELEEKK